MREIDEFWEEYANKCKPATEILDQIAAHQDDRAHAMELAGYAKDEILAERVQVLEELLFGLLRRLYT